MGAALRLALLSLLFGTAGCAEVMYRYDQSTASAALAAMACKDMLSEANTQRVNACGQLLKAGASDRTSVSPEAPAKAQACLDAWKGKYEKVDTACKSLKVGAKIALESRAVVEAAATKNKDALGWIARLTKLAIEVVAAFADIGLTFTSVGGLTNG